MNLLFLLACAGEPTLTLPIETVSEMDPVDVLTRASLDLRGVRPTDVEIARVEEDAEAVEDLIDEYLYDPRFPDRLVEMYSEIYLTLSESFLIYATDYGLSSDLQPHFQRSVGEEPLRILARIGADDLPYTDLVTADWTMANEILATVWPLDYPASGTGWQPATYTDGRPAAGVLVSTGMWWRYTSTDSNLNRKRANQVSRILLCNDYLTRPIEFDRNVNLLDEEALNEAIQSSPGCLNCHVSLDPIASYFYGFWYITGGDSVADATPYHPERETMWQQTNEVAPSYYGKGGGSLSDLGHLIAADPRFPSCAVEQATSLLLKRDLTLADTPALTEHREAFLTDGLTLRALFRSVIGHAYYRSGPTKLPGYVPKKMLSADQLASQVEDLTGFRWTYLDYDMMLTDTLGVGNLVGRADGYRMTRNNASPNATVQLVQARLAEAAASHAVAVEQTLAPDQRRLFTEIDFTETPETNADTMATQLAALHLRLFGTRVGTDGEEVQANIELFEELLAVDGDIHDAWIGVLSALMRDPDFLLY